VPAGYQRNFADGKLIRVIERQTWADRVVGVGDNFVASHFLRAIINGQANDAAEDEFARIENAALPLIRTIEAFVPRSPDQMLAVKAVMAMLWARSFSREVVAKRVHREVLEEYRLSVPANSQLLARFERKYGRSPVEGELERILDQQAAEMVRSRLHDIEAMMRHYNQALEKFSPLHIAVYRPIRGAEFVTSDNPVLLARDNQLIQVGAQSGLALFDASFIFLPISRRVGACLTMHNEGDLELDRLTTLKLNQAMWRNAVTRIACHPSLDGWAAACNVRRR
jgi:hypothetical protein